jgi:competence protein ComEA
VAAPADRAGHASGHGPAACEPGPGGLTRGAAVAALVLAAAMLAACGVELARRHAQSPLARPPAAASGAAFQLDVNTAGWAELSLVPGLGPALSRAVVAYRSRRGRIESLDELTDVPGIGEKRLESLRPWLTVGGGGR